MHKKAKPWRILVIIVKWRHHANVHPRRPRGSQSGRVKRRYESVQAWAEEPLGTDSHRTICKRSRECWLLIGHKKCFVLLCPIGEQFLLSSFRQFVHDGYSCPVRSPTFPNQKRRNYQWVEKRFVCYQQELFNLHWENFVSDGSQCIVNNSKFKKSGDERVKKAIAWQGKTTTLHVHLAFLYISLPSLHDYHLKMPNFTFCKGRKQAMTKFSFSFWTVVVFTLGC